MIKNSPEASRKALEITHRLEHGEIDIKMATTLLKGLEVYQKGCLIDIMKNKVGIDQLPSEDSATNGKMFVKKLS